MAARAGAAQGEVLIPQEAWDALAADPRLQEFQRRHGVELRVQGSGPRRGQRSVCLTLQPPAPWHQEAQVRDELIGLCNARRGRRAAAVALSERPDPSARPPDPCPICLGEMRDPKPLSLCGHAFCRPCIDQAFRTRPACPVCGQLYGVVTGNQPVNASMTVTKDKSLHLPGYENSGTILISYYIPSGTQG
ncbi:E3 ubiquitin-protein ligase DTX3L-like, partial [Cetorhinus maximus]